MSGVVIDEKTVKNVAKLARLKLTDEETRYYEKHLNVVFQYVEKIKSLKDNLGSDWRADLSSGEHTPERDDVIIASLPTDEFLSQAPKKIGTAFQVPKILDQ